MEKFAAFRGLVAPIDKDNIDTDAIIPKQFMKSIRRTGFGGNLFDAWRYADAGEPGKPSTDRVPRPEFVLNQPRYAGASILLTGTNFGCGSSREHAPWALQQFGFRVLIAPSFGEIFLSNAFKNGLLAISLEAATVRTMFEDIATNPGYCLDVDLEGQRIGLPDGSLKGFAIDPFRKQCLIDGADEIQLTLRHADKIAAFEAARLLKQPWLGNKLP